jgi:probable DNA metabolism protein
LKIHIYDGTFDGFLTACGLLMGDCRDFDIQCAGREDEQEGLFDRRETVTTDIKESLNMKNLIFRSAGAKGLNMIMWAFLSEIKGIEKDILNYINFASEHGQGVNSSIADSRVNPVFRASEKSAGEAHRLKGFLRFIEAAPGKFCAEMNPCHNILVPVARHFASRMSGLDWVIHDTLRGITAVYVKGELQFKKAESVEFGESEIRERDFEKMWRAYFKAMAITERENNGLQRKLVPKKYRKNMTEFKSY